MRAMILAFGAAVLLFSSIAQAQIGGACCYCGKGVKLTEEGAGFARDWVGFCGECQKEIGDVDAYLKKLQGQFRGLADAAKQTNARLKEKLKERDEARDSIFGPKGSAVGFFKSLMSFAAEGSGAKWKKVAEYTGKGIDYYNKAADTLKGDFKWVWEDGKGWVQGKAIDKTLLKIAAGQAKEHYAKTKDARGSTKLFLERHKQLKDGLSFLSGAKDLYDDGNQLADGIQAYLEARQDSDRLYNEWDQLTEQMDDLLRRIGKLKHCRDGMNKQKQKKAPGQSRGGSFGPGMVVVGMLQAGEDEDLAAPTAQERKELKAWVADENQPAPGDLKKVLESLAKMKEELGELQKFFEEEVFAPLAPFWVEVNDEMGPELSLALLKWAKPNVQEAGRKCTSVVKSGRQVASYLRRTPGALVGSSRGYWLRDAPDGEELVLMDDGVVKTKSSAGREMSFRMRNVDEKKKQVELMIGKAKEPVVIGEGESKRLDLDGDGVEDVEVGVKQLSEWNAAVAVVKALRQ